MASVNLARSCNAETQRPGAAPSVRSSALGGAALVNFGGGWLVGPEPCVHLAAVCQGPVEPSGARALDDGEFTALKSRLLEGDCPTPDRARGWRPARRPPPAAARATLRRTRRLRPPCHAALQARRPYKFTNIPPTHPQFGWRNSSRHDCSNQVSRHENTSVGRSSTCARARGPHGII